MSEIEVPTEHLHEEIHEKAHGGEPWVMGVALSTAFLAAFAAIAALMAGHHVNEALIDQIQASDHWSYYQAKGIKSQVQLARLQILEGLGKKVPAEDKAKLDDYKKEQQEIKEKAEEKEKSSEAHLVRHVTLARAVTLFQVAIAVAAIAVLTKRQPFWYVSLGFGAVGLYFLALGLL